MEKKEFVPEEEIKLKKPEINEKDLEIQRLKSENEELKKHLEELEAYILEQKKKSQVQTQQQNFLDNPLVGAIAKVLIDKFTEPKTSEIDSLLYYQEKARALREAMRSPIEDELIKTSLEMQKALLESQKTNLQFQQMMMKGFLKNIGVPLEEKKKSINIRIPPEAFEHE
ncbi:MAG: hypothetical protein QW734_03760 [Candidatus Bathyarchaeia archaeon]